MVRVREREVDTMANMGFVTVQFESDDTLEQNPNLNDPNVVTITETGIYRGNGDGKVNVVAGGGTGSSGSGGLSPTLYYTKKQIDAILKERDLGQYYTKTEANALLLQKLDKNGLDNYLTEDETNTALDAKVNKIDLQNNYYDKTQVDAQHSSLVADIYNKSEIGALLNAKVDKATIEANYTNNANLKKQLLEKADKTDLDTQTTKHNNDIIQLTAAMQEVSDELTATVTKLTETANKVTEIVPTDASATNKLTSKEYVDNAVKTAAARAISSDADGAGFASLDALKAGPWYSLGESTTPTTNDYAVVKKDASHSGNDVRYNYDGAVWVFFQEFTSGSSVTFTTAQQLAIDSGITTAKVTQIQTNSNDLITEQTARIKGDADLAADIEKRVKEASNKIGDITTLNTDVKTSIVEAMNDLHDELHTERLACDGSNQMTAQLDIVLDGSGDLLLLKAGDKGVNFTLDATTGVMGIIPESAPTTGFDVSAVSLKPRTTAYPYSLGDNNSYFTNAYIKNLNNVAVSDYLTTTDLSRDDITQMKDDISTNKTDIANRVNKAGDTMTGTLKVSLPTSGDLIYLESQGKGATFSMDGNTGYMHIIPVSAPTTGFEISANTLMPRTNAIPYNLGGQENTWDNGYIENLKEVKTLNGTDVTELVVSVAQVKKLIIELEHPIGSVIHSFDYAYDPNNVYADTTWEKIKEGIFLEATTTTAGTEKEAGLPNITGTVNFHMNTIQDATGSLYVSKSYTYEVTPKSGTDYNKYNGLGFNASRSSVVYGKSDTVQPHSITCFIWKRTA
jgi:hypothetical protein